MGSEGPEEEYRPKFHGGGNDTCLPGDDNFMNKCRYGTTEKPIRLTLQEIVNKVCLAYAIDEVRLKAPVQERVASEARAVVGWLAYNLGGITLSGGREIFGPGGKPESANRIIDCKRPS